MPKFLKNNALTLALFTLFAFSIIGQAISGWYASLEEAHRHAQPAMDLLTYLTTGTFLSAVAENMESEFLQMSAYLFLTAIFVQKGAKESRKPEGGNPEDEDRSGRQGVAHILYSHSMGIALVLLTALSFIAHLLASTSRANEEAQRHGEPLQTVAETVASSDFWFESFQNFQSEFFSLAMLLLLSVYLRQKGSSQSKPVDADNDQTGD